MEEVEEVVVMVVVVEEEVVVVVEEFEGGGVDECVEKEELIRSWYDVASVAGVHRTGGGRSVGARAREDF